MARGALAAHRSQIVVSCVIVGLFTVLQIASVAALGPLWLRLASHTNDAGRAVLSTPDETIAFTTYASLGAGVVTVLAGLAVAWLAGRDRDA